MTSRRSAATAAEQAELRALSGQAEQSRREVGDTVQALAGKIAKETDIRARARQAAQQLRASGYLRVAAIGVPAVLVAAVVTWQVVRRTSPFR